MFTIFDFLGIICYDIRRFGGFMKIKLYDEKNNKVIYNVGAPFDRGSYGVIYKINDDACLKNFYYGNVFETLNVMKDIRNLNLDNFYKIYDFLFDNNGDFCGYTMKYYQDENIDIMTMPTDYLINNLRTITNSVKRLTDKQICVIDLREHNVIMDKNNIIVIDVDLYNRKDYPLDYLNQINTDAVYRMFINLCYRTLDEKHFTTTYDMTYLTELFNYKEDTDIVSKKLVKYKYPIDYINECRIKY